MACLAGEGRSREQPVSQQGIRTAEFGGVFYFILQFFIYLSGKEPEVILFEAADLIRSPQP